MKKPRFSTRQVVLVFLAGLAVLAGSITLGLRLSSDPGAAGSEMLTQSQARKDFDLMRQALEEAQTGLYRYSPKGDLDRIFAEARIKLATPIRKLDFLKLLEETIAQIHCGHTQVRPDSHLGNALFALRKCPLRFLLEGRRLVVLFNDTTDNQTIRPGMEVTEINGRSSGEILDLLWPILPADGDIQTGKKALLQRHFSDLYWEFIDQSDTFHVVAKNSSGQTIVAQLLGVTEKNQKHQNPVNSEIREGMRQLRWSDKNVALRFLGASKTAELKIGSFTGDDYPRQLEAAFETLRANATETLIIDVRGNGGGGDMYGAMLVACLTDKPFRYFDHIDVKTAFPSFLAESDWRQDEREKWSHALIPNPAGGFLVNAQLHAGVAEVQPGKTPFLGKVLVLTDGGTFSTAADFCAVTHHLKRATFIGEETGGGYYGNNSGVQAMVTLPNSNFEIRVPMYEYWNAVPGYAGTRRGTIPDYPVETRGKDLLQGLDEPLQVALDLSKLSLALGSHH